MQPALWDLPDLSSAGNGMKIGIIDMGIDPKLPYFDAAGYTYPPGYPKGDRAWTSPKVIAARGFSPPDVTWKHARAPYDPVELPTTATTWRGIAAGNYGTPAIDGRVVSGIAPRKRIWQLQGLCCSHAPVRAGGELDEVVAAIEAAVSDGMDVINLSLGEYEVSPARNLVESAIDAAADAGVVPVSAAGNSFEELGRGSVGSPASAAKGIAGAAVTNGGRLASWSSQGPTPVSLRLKPDVSAPGRRGSLGGANPRGNVGVVQPHEHGVPPCRRRRGSPPRSPSRLDRGGYQVGARSDGPPRDRRRRPLRRRQRTRRAAA